MGLTNRKTGKHYRRKNESVRESKAGIFLICFIVTITFYITMLYLESRVISFRKTKVVYVSTADIIAGTFITEDNVGSLFRGEERAEDELPNGYIDDLNQIVGKMLKWPMSEKEIAILTDFVNEADMISDIVNPIEVSLGASNLSQVVGGVLRKGDYVNIWSVRTAYLNGESRTLSELICRRAYVTGTYTSSGVEVRRDSDNDIASMVINVIISEEQEEAFNTAIAGGTLRISRCLDDEMILKSTGYSQKSNGEADEDSN